MAAAYDLAEAHVSFVTGSGETTNKVQSIVEDATTRRAELVEEHAGGAFEGATGQTDGTDTAEESGLVSEPDDGADGSDGAGASDEADTTESGDTDDADEDQSGLTDFM
jgi:replication factor C large subunit